MTGPVDPGTPPVGTRQRAGRPPTWLLYSETSNGRYLVMHTDERAARDAAAEAQRNPHAFWPHRRLTLGQVLVAPDGASEHLWGRAFDLDDPPLFTALVSARHRTECVGCGGWTDTGLYEPHERRCPPCAYDRDPEPRPSALAWGGEWRGGRHGH